MIFLYILLGLLALILVLAIAAPKNYNVHRSIVLNRSISDTFQYLKLIKNQDHWSPWKSRDPNMTQEFSGTDGEIGFVSRWEGNKEVGTGEQELTGFVENERIDSELRFLKPWKSVSDAYFLLKETEPGMTEVTWGFKGVNKIPINIMMLFYNIEKAVGKDFNEGLANLKSVLEI